MSDEADLRKQIEELQAQLDLCARATLILVQTALATLAMVTEKTSEGARDATVQVLRTRLREIENTIKTEPIPPPQEAH